MKTVKIKPLTKESFAPFGEVITVDGAENFEINNGTTTRFHDLAEVQLLGDKARAMISIFRCQEFQLPIAVKMMERHPLGSQAFIPLNGNSFLIVVARDDNNAPGEPHAFVVSGTEGVNYHADIWHATLMALEGAGDFLIVDRGGEGNNLQEHLFDVPFQVN